jgi:hypothetical protein
MCGNFQARRLWEVSEDGLKIYDFARIVGLSPYYGEVCESWSSILHFVWNFLWQQKVTFVKSQYSFQKKNAL